MDENKTFNISMPKALLDAIDKQAEVEFRNRSDLIREAVRKYIVLNGGMSTGDNLTSTEESRIKNNLNFSNFLVSPTILLSCVFRPQPNSTKDIFTANSKIMNLIENPPKLRNMGWDLDTLDRARPVAGEYLQVANGKQKLLRVYRDGQHIFSGGLDFFGHAVNREIELPKYINLLSVAEFIYNFITFSNSLSDDLEKDAKSFIFSIAVSNPMPEGQVINKKTLELQAYDGLGTEKVGKLELEWVERNIVVKVSDKLTVERIAYLIYSEFCYFFGNRSDELWYVNNDSREIDKNVFLRAGR